MRKITKIIFLTILSCLVFSKPLFSTIIYSNDSDNWNDTDAWVGGVIPTSTDTVIIKGHDVNIDDIDSVAVLRLEIINDINSNSSLTVEDDAVFKVLGDLYMVSFNHDKNVKLKGTQNANIYIDGNVLLERELTNNNNAKLQLHLNDSAELLIGGSLEYNYKSSGSENEKEIHLEKNTKMTVTGATIFNISGGDSFYIRAHNSAQLLLKGGLTMTMTDGVEANIESNGDAKFHVIGDVDLINNDNNIGGSDLGINLFTGGAGGNIIIEGDLRLASSKEDAKTTLSTPSGATDVSVTGDLILDAEFENTANVILDATTKFQLGGDILRPKFFGKISMNDNSHIVFNGTTKQTIPQAKLPNSGTDSLYLSKVRFNNPNGFILNGDLVIYDSLNLISGIFVTTDDNMLIIANGAKISAGSDTAHVDGPLTKIGAEKDVPFIFPIGDQGKYAPVEIIPLGNSSTSSYTGGYDKCPPPFDKITSAPLTQISGTQFWTITRTAGSQNFDVVLHWQDAAAEGINETDSLVVATLNSTLETWETLGNGGITGGVGAGVAGSVRNDDKCPPPFDRVVFTFGTHPSALNALPSEVISFEGKKMGKNIQLNWVTASEIFSDLFIVERSTDGVSFEEITRVNAQGNSTTLQQYKAEDKFPEEGINYYKLQRVDLDGSTLPTEIIAVNFTKENGAISIYPNPIQDVVNIMLENETTGEVAIEVFSQNGQQIFEGTFEPSGNKLSIPIQHLNIKERGAYVILYQGQFRTQTLRFIKVD